MITVGVISDTHALLRDAALAALAGSDHIVHAGDVGDPAVLDALRAVAPVFAVRGNNDHGAWAERLPASLELELGGRRLFVLHDVAELGIDPSHRGVDVVIAGHSHRPAVMERHGVLYVNPGSAGPRRFSLPVAVAMLRLGPRTRLAEIVELESSRG